MEFASGAKCSHAMANPDGWSVVLNPATNDGTNRIVTLPVESGDRFFDLSSKRQGAVGGGSVVGLCAAMRKTIVENFRALQ